MALLPTPAARRLAILLAAPLAAAAPALAKETGKGPPPLQAGSVDGAGVYQLSAEEQAMDCKRLTGRVQIRILQLRNMQPAQKTSDLSHTMKQTAEPVASLLLGKSSSFNADPNKRLAEDRAMLTAYNKQLAAKSCKTFDIDAELAKTGTAGAPPAPKAPAAAPPAAKPPAR